MPIQVLPVPSAASLAALEAAIRQSETQYLLFVLPTRSPLLTEQLDCARLQQLARQSGVTIGVVSRNPLVSGPAQAAGIPVYPTEWWGKRRLTRPRRAWLPAPWGEERGGGRPTVIDAADRAVVQRRYRPRPAWLAWLGRYLTIILFCITLAIVGIAAFYLAPHASITLKPYQEELRVTRQIVADPQIDAVNLGGATVPGRILVDIEKWQASLATSGVIELPSSPARGLVVFANQIPQAVTIPAGTRVSTSTGNRLIYQTLATVEAPAVIGAQVEVEVTAVTPGEEGNVAIGRINRIEGPLAAQLNVRNLQPLSGGAVQPTATATQADFDRLRQHVLETLRARAIAEMKSELEPGEFLAEDSVRVVLIYYENYSHSQGQPTNSLTMEMRAALHGTAVQQEAALTLIYDELRVNVRKGFSLLPETIRPELGQVVGVDNQGRVSLMLAAQGTLSADLPVAQMISAIRGQDLDVAMTYLTQSLLLREPPTMKVWPAWFGRMPYIPVRIQATIDNNS